MEPSLVISVVTFLTIEGFCFACAYNNVFRRLRAVEARLNSMGAAPSAEPVPVPVVSSAYQVPQATPQVYYYPPQMVAPSAPSAPPQSRPSIVGGDDPLPVTYASYYQNRR